MDKRSAGFTLIEVIVATAIFALVAAIAASGLSSISKSYSALADQRADRHALARALSAIELDLQQAAARAVRSPYGSVEPAFVGDSNSFELSSSSLSIASTGPQPSLLRVRYQTRQGSLFRLVRRELDAAPNSQQSQRALLSEVQNVRLQYWDFGGARSPIWPPANSNYSIDQLPRALEIRILHARFGELVRLVPISDVPPPPKSSADLNP
jgi:general secretion pathway protein J